MSDTIQTVRWTLGHTCKLRSGASETQPSNAFEAVSIAQMYSKKLRNRKEGEGHGVFGEIFVSGSTIGRRPAGQKGISPHYPDGGFIIEEQFKSVGGAVGLAAMCGACPANTIPHEMARCVGSLFQEPDSGETDEQLRGIISKLGLKSAVAEAFPQTRPLWYGLWAISPVPKRSLPLLKLLVGEMLAEDRRDMEIAGKIDEDQLAEFGNFVSAIDLAERNALPLYVSLAPPGHFDFGIYTAFPHCPFCKAQAQVAPWQRKYPTALCKCQVCGQSYSPAATATSERINWDHRELREILGLERFREFAKFYLVELGESTEAAEEIVRVSEAELVERQAKWVKERELEAKRERYVDANVLHGLTAVAAPKSDIVGDNEEETGPSRWYGPEDFEEILRRCQALGVGITFMIHRSQDGENDEYTSTVSTKNALGLFMKWRDKGCREKFRAGFRVPRNIDLGS
jgi:hypothetical protein